MAIMKEKERFEILLEDISGKIDRLAEVVDSHTGEFKNVNDRLARIEDKIDRYDAGMLVIKDHSIQLQDHDDKIQSLRRQVA
jgi:chromosome segregation ATPase